MDFETVIKKIHPFLYLAVAAVAVMVFVLSWDVMTDLTKIITLYIPVSAIHMCEETFARNKTGKLLMKKAGKKSEIGYVFSEYVFLILAVCIPALAVTVPWLRMACILTGFTEVIFHLAANAILDSETIYTSGLFTGVLLYLPLSMAGAYLMFLSGELYVSDAVAGVVYFLMCFILARVLPGAFYPDAKG